MPTEPFEPSVRLQILTDKQIEQIHAAALDVLADTGITLNTDRSRQILLNAGCKTAQDNAVLIPAKLVEKCLKTAPSSVVLYDRLQQPRCVLEGWKTSFGTGSDCPFIVDSDTSQRRMCTHDDVAHGALVCDALDNIDFVMPVGIISDRPRMVADVHSVAATAANTVKPVVFTAHNARTYQASLDVAAAILGGMDQLQEKPFVCLYAEPTSPLRCMPEAEEKLILSAKLRIPIVFTPCCQMGATAPATAAGLLVQACAECLSGLVIHQLVNPGAPIIFGGVMTNLDMSTTVMAYGSPELHQLCAALTDMSHFYKLPMFGTCGCSDSKRVDAQAGLEMGFSVLTSTLNGQNLVHDIGFLESALVTSFEIYVLADEAIGMAKHIARGISVNTETLAADVIRDGKQQGDFLQHDHTLKHFRREMYFPKILDRRNYTGWYRAGAKGLDARLTERVGDILTSHKPEPLPRDTELKIREILSELHS